MTRSTGVHAIDLRHLGLPGAITSYLVLEPEPTLVDPGPAPCIEALEAGLETHGLRASDLRHVALTHIHLDHAGASGHLTRDHPDLVVHVHRDGAPHLVDPERLVASTRRTFGEDHDRMWGRVLPVPADRIRAWEPKRPGPPGLRPIASPGHIAHHLAFLDEVGGTLFSGDALGIRLAPGAPVHPPTPAPSFDAEAWQKTLDELGGVGAERIGVAHSGLHEGNTRAQAEELSRVLDALVGRVRTALAQGADAILSERERFEAESREVQAHFWDVDSVDRYFDVFRPATDFDGVRFYLERQQRADTN